MAISGKLNGDTRRGFALFGVRLIDDAHMAWIAAEVESEHALHAWFESAASNRTRAYLAYRAAVDREQSAAGELQRLCQVTWLYSAQPVAAAK